jgi:hypothetical protein
VESADAIEQLLQGPDDDDVFYLLLQKQKIGAELHIYLEEGTYHKRLFRGATTNDMKKWDGPSPSSCLPQGPGATKRRDTVEVESKRTTPACAGKEQRPFSICNWRAS